MPVVRLSRHGLTAGNPPPPEDPEQRKRRSKRRECAGWSHTSTRNNTRFLRSIDERKLSGVGLAITLTIRDCPPDAAAWHRVRRAFIKRLHRLGMLRLHWATEWQRRRVPHLHAAVYFPELPSTWLQGLWLEVADRYSPAFTAQHITPIYDAVGWVQYVSKHAARGVAHYQRSPDSIPPGWQTKTGRVWGHVGDWPVAPELKLRTDLPCFWAFRRLVRSWRHADARAAGHPQRIRQARQMLSCGLRELSTVRGVSEWIDAEQALRLVAILAERGLTVES